MRWCPDGDFLGIFLGPAFPASRAQHISDLHSKFTLGPHHVSTYGIDIQSAAAEIRRGKKRKKEETGRKYIYVRILLCRAAIKQGMQKVQDGVQFGRERIWTQISFRLAMSSWSYAPERVTLFFSPAGNMFGCCTAPCCLQRQK